MKTAITIISAIADCKNKDGKTLTEVYTVVPAKISV